MAVPVAIPIGLDPISERRAQLTNELAALSVRFTDRYPEVRRLKAELAALPPSPGHRGDSPLPVGSDLQAAALQQQQDSHPSFTVVREAPSPQLEAETQVYAGLLARSEEVRGDAASTSTFRMIEPALASVQPAGPDRTRLLALGLALAMALAVGAAVAAEQLDTSIHNTEELGNLQGVTLLGSVPRFDTKGSIRKRRAIAAGVFILVTLWVAAAWVGGLHIGQGNEHLAWALSLHHT